MKSQKKHKAETDRIMVCMEIGKLLTSTLDSGKILELIMLKVSELVKAQNWSLMLKDEETGELTFEVVVGVKKELLKGLRIAPGKGIACHVAETGAPEILSNLKNDPRFYRSVDSITGFKTKSIICIPLQIHGKILGVIEILNVRDIENFKSKHLQLLMVLADYAAIAIENSRNFARIQQMSITDEYTGLYNARYLYQTLEELIRNAHKRKTSFAVVFVDIDNFKKVVDGYGHLLGTQILKEIGKTLSACLTKEDILVKYGGDEYVIILPDMNKRTAVNRTEKMLKSLRKSTYLQSESKPVRLTASFGLAMYPGNARTVRELLKLADNAMYGIKKLRKNGIGMIT